MGDLPALNEQLRIDALQQVVPLEVEAGIEFETTRGEALPRTRLMRPGRIVDQDKMALWYFPG
jgi:hypothetical protein